LHSFWLPQISAPVFEKVLQQLQQSGNTVTPIMLVPNAGNPAYTVNGSGIVAQVVFDAANQRALVTILSKPFLVPVSYIEGKVREALRAARV
jgi:hypothetical protein